MTTLPSTLKAFLNRLPGNRPRDGKHILKTALIGVGNPLRTDDAAGMMVVQGLLDRGIPQDAERWMILGAGAAPENITAELRRFGPDLVIFLDAADLGEAPGSVRVVLSESIEGMSASTHTLPLSLLSEYLISELGCTVALIGIQPQTNVFSEGLSPGVARAVRSLIEELDEFLEYTADLK